MIVFLGSETTPRLSPHPSSCGLEEDECQQTLITFPQLAIIVGMAAYVGEALLSAPLPFSSSICQKQIRKILRPSEETDTDSRGMHQKPSGGVSSERDSVDHFRFAMTCSRPNHLWEKLRTMNFWQGPAHWNQVRTETHPTQAGLLMFGNEQAIRSVFPLIWYRSWITSTRFPIVSYQRIAAGAGIFMIFYFKVCYRLSEYFTYQFRHTPEEAEVAMALKEALAN